MNKTLLAGLAMVMLVVGIGSLALMHSAEAKGMPKCWLNSDGTVKQQYLQYLKSTGSKTKFPIPVLERNCRS